MTTTITHHSKHGRMQGTVSMEAGRFTGCSLRRPVPLGSMDHLSLPDPVDIDNLMAVLAELRTVLVPKDS